MIGSIAEKGKKLTLPTRNVELFIACIYTVIHKSSRQVSMTLGMQLKIQNEESSLQIWHVESSLCAAVATGFLWVIHVLHFCRRCSMNFEGGVSQDHSHP